MVSGNKEIRERLSSLESLLGAVSDGEDVCNLVAKIFNLEANMEQIQESLMEEMATMTSNVEMKPHRPVVRVPKPKSFGGTRSAKELKNFLWDMEQHFVVAKVHETKKATITSMYLVGDAKLWWRTHMVDDANAGQHKIDTWDRLKKEMKDQFLPGNTSWLARDGLKRLKQSGFVQNYVKEFSSLMLDIQNMFEEDKLYNFLYSLQPWVQVELQRKNVKDLPSALVAADAVVGKTNMMVIPFEDFQIIMGLNFLRKTKIVSMSHLEGVMVMQESNPYFVPGMHPYGKGQKKGKMGIIYAMSLEKGLKRGKITYFATLINMKPDKNVELPVGVKDIWSKLKDMMPSKLPKRLPPRRNVDHKIEFILSVVPPVSSPYRMSPLELTELCK
ncbi:hypothetical protein ZIOFF_033067 [Zingiber officinale]|uniref:Retrotransposon gag domain-containing protein n=1 Tax=Zingiber officinale TaxID=94328 RepID=A0A8J5GHR7_ZINOF|nr:hypothetical protein ZIOFF_033067 [Zingiber officinale]